MARHKRRHKIRPYAVTAAIIIMIAVIGISITSLSEVIERYLYPREYSDIVSRCAKLYGVPEEIVFAVIRTESGFDSKAVSRAGASGLMQLMPETYEWLSEKRGLELPPDKIFVPDVNIELGTYMLSMLYSEFESWSVVYAAYNAGPGRVRGWLADEDMFSDGELTSIPIKETERYVELVSHAAFMYKKLYY